MMTIACYDYCPVCVCEAARPVRFGPTPAPTSLRELFAWIASHYAHEDWPEVTLRTRRGAALADGEPLQVQALIPTLCRRCARADEASHADNAGNEASVS